MLDHKPKTLDEAEELYRERPCKETASTYLHEANNYADDNMITDQERDAIAADVAPFLNAP